MSTFNQTLMCFHFDPTQPDAYSTTLDGAKDQQTHLTDHMGTHVINTSVFYIRRTDDTVLGLPFQLLNLNTFLF